MLRNERARPWLVTAVAVGLLTVGTATTASAEDRLVLDHGHIDAFTLTWNDGTLDLQLQEDVTGSHVPHAPEDVLLRVKPESALELPDPVPPSLSFLGQPGDTVYYLPQTQDPELLWPGWSTERIPAGLFTDPLRIQVTDVTGPGDVFLWQTGSFGGPVSVLGGGFQLPGTISPNVNVHAHANWAFTEEGTYSFTAVASGDLAAGGTATSAPRTYTFQVGDTAEPAPVTTLSVTGMADHYHSGDVVTLSAVQDPATGLDHYHWFTRAAGSDEWVIVPDAAGAEYSFTATAQHDGLAVIARLYDHDHAVVAESEPVTVVVDDHGVPEPPAPASQDIEVTLSDAAGALVISVDPADRRVRMSDLALSTSGDRWVSSGDLRPVTVTDTRFSAPGWSVSGQVGDFSSGAEKLRGGSLGWTPVVTQQPTAAGVLAGPSVASGFTSGDGLSVAGILASAAPGSGAGTSKLGAGLTIEAPTTLRPAPTPRRSRSR
ncbi:choice-of-anchor M domain-containing protein [Actinophytocola algeriensis]|uniref:Surface-anchored protein n=1 Tax=Actinophytocola algeriensis TaxID=1768010 RepID=A0A7W7Q8B4_9PSEU|nr:choice-of-anchor M domain-containing protein [Actinophytocola algeriensis]MBB4908708.1 surface-anchored protein [Actinophytocola algeriensis]MBE1474905.1 surface-anchored protein [Actinophytocola algeriensis]